MPTLLTSAFTALAGRRLARGLVAGFAMLSLGAVLTPHSQLHLPVHPEAASIPTFDHIFTIAMENRSYSDVIGNPAAPFINSLASQYGVAANYFAVSHPSLPNYLARTGGSTFGIINDCESCYINAPNIADSVERAGRTWKAYMEDMPAPCYLGDSGAYTQALNPFIYYNDIRTNPSRCANIVPYTQLQTDLASAATTPSYVWITPNTCHDMHSCSVSVGDQWLQGSITAILNSPAYTQQRSLILVSWDEDTYLSGNHVATLVIGPGVQPGYVSNVFYNHYSLLRTVETAWGLLPLTANDANASPLGDFFYTRTRLETAPGSAPDASSWGPGRVDLVETRSDSSVWHSHSNDGGSTYVSEPLGGVASSAPAAVAWAPNRLDVFVRGGDGALWHKWWDGAWHGWQPLGGRLRDGPEVAAWSANRLDIVARGADDHLWHLCWDGIRWHSWENLGGVLSAAPAALSPAPGRLTLFARGTDMALWEMQWTGARWTRWQSLGGRLGGRPDATLAPGGAVVVAKGFDSAVWKLSLTGSGAPSGWASLGGYWSGDPAAAAPDAQSLLVFERSLDGSLWQITLPEYP